MYSLKTQQPNNCKVKYVKINQTIVIALHHTNEWLYSTHKPQIIHLNCKNNSQYKEQFDKTGLLKKRPACKARINNVTIYAPELMDEGVIETYLPEYNVTLSMLKPNNKYSRNKIKRNHNQSKRIKQFGKHTRRNL